MRNMKAICAGTILALAASPGWAQRSATAKETTADALGEKLDLSPLRRGTRLKYSPYALKTQAHPTAPAPTIRGRA